MALESVTWVTDLVAANPPGTDLKKEGDNHLRNIKTGLLASFPNASRAFYFPRNVNKTGNYTILAADMSKLITADATGGAFNLTLPTLAAGDDGWEIKLVRTNSGANAVTIVGTVNGTVNPTLARQYSAVTLRWTGSAWVALYEDITQALRNVTTARLLGRSTAGTGQFEEISLGTNLSFVGSVLTFTASAILYGSNPIFINGTLVPSVGSNALTVTVKTLAGATPSASDPVYVLVRSATAANGDFTVLTITAATTLVISSGSTLGATSSTAFKIWIVGFNDAGTFRLGAINCLSGTSIYPLSDGTVVSSTAEGGAGAADSTQVFYTGSAVASKPYAILGYMTWEAGLATAGTWNAVPTRTQLKSPDVPLPGTTIQSQHNMTGAVATGTTTLPNDDTIPQNTEGDQYMSQAITPLSAANLIHIEAGVQTSNSASNAIAAALFQDATANALASTSHNTANTFERVKHALSYKQLAASTSAQTFKIRAGGHSAGTTTFNGSGGTRTHGGVQNSFMECREIAT